MNEEISSPMASAPVSPAPAAVLDANAQVVPHVTSTAVWDVPFPVVLDTTFKIKVGVKCSLGCKLAGSAVEVYDHTKAPVAAGTVGDELLPGIDSLYWTEIELRAPVTEGPFNWTARITPREPEATHAEASHGFAFATVQPPEHVVTVRVTDKEKSKPIKHAKVIMHPFSGFTDENGIARVGVTTGEYQLWIPKIAKYDTWRTTVQVENDIDVEAELVPAPVPEP